MSERLRGAGRLRHSVRWRLTLAVGGLVLVTGAGLAWLLVDRVQSTLLADVEEQHADVLHQVARRLENGQPPGGRFLVPVSVPGEAGGGGTAPDEQWQAFVPAPGTAPSGMIVLVGDPTRSPLATPGPDNLVSSLPVATDDGVVEVSAASPLDEIQHSIDALRGALLVAVPAAAAAIGALAWILIGRALRPVEAIAARADRITAAEPGERVPVPASDDEVTHLARTVNRMLDRLSEAAARQRTFVSDASHELRSPIASIQTGLEVALADPADDCRDAARQALVEGQRLDALVDDLLVLARVAEQPVAGSGRADLRDTATTEARRRRRVPVNLDVDDSMWVAMPEGDLDRVVRHLLDNSARHACSRVDVLTRVADREAVVVVDDDGPGIPAADRERVFERFTRLDEGRDRRSGGGGLGLAVVKALVEQRGGRVVAGASPVGGARFTVRLPLTEPVRETRRF